LSQFDIQVLEEFCRSGGHDLQASPTEEPDSPALIPGWDCARNPNMEVMPL
jgi:hypothetical protein